MSWEPKDPWGQHGGQDPLDDILKKVQERWQQVRPTRGMNWLIILIGVIFLLVQGVFIVEPDEQGLVKRFGDVVRTVGPGPNLKIPFIETVATPKVEKLHRVEVGFQTDPRGRTRIIPQEALMLTGDMNILSVEFIVQYKIREARDYLYNVADIEQTVQKAAEAAMREIIGRSKIDEALTAGKAAIQLSAQELLQGILNQYTGGVQIAQVQLQDVNPPEQVAGAFKDVASAKEDREKLINQSHGYRNDILPKANGQAAQDINQAKAYAQARISRAEGEANHFLQTLKEYKQSPSVISKRIYIETMEEILSKVDKVILDSKVAGNVLPYLPLDRLSKKGSQP